MEFLNFILNGTDMVTALLFLLPLAAEEDMKNTVKEYYEKFMKMKGIPVNENEIDEFIAFVSDDEFPAGTFQHQRNWDYLPVLKELKENIVKFYFTGLKELQKGNISFNDVRDVYLRINNYMLQLMRLRMVINPDFKLSRNKHPQTGITYLAIKTYWLDDSGKRIRRFTKSVGRAEDFEGGLNDKDAIEKGLSLIQPAMFELYKETYPD